jgi:hypothetical protein
LKIKFLVKIGFIFFSMKNLHIFTKFFSKLYFNSVYNLDIKLVFKGPNPFKKLLNNQNYSIKNHPSMKSNFYLLLSIFLMLGSVPAFAQIGIGTKTPAPSAALEVTSSTNNKGILIPRITATQKDAIASPAQGLLVYQTTAPIGFYYYTGTSWKLMAIQTDLAGKVDKVDGKDLSSNDYSIAEKTKLAAITGTNTGDQTTITGNAGTATKLATARNINGVAFDGSTDITIAAAASAEQLTGTTLKSTVTGSSLTSVGTLGNLTVTNPIAGSVTGNAATATKLAATKNINGVAFDGSADITIAAAASAEQLTGTTLKSTVTGSSLTSVGTLGNLTVTNPIAGSVTGNAATATKLAASKNINGVAFDGSADITVPATAGTLTGIVAIANGGTNSTDVATAGGIGYGTGTSHAYTAAGTTGQVLSSNGAGVPTWITPASGGDTHTIGESYGGGIVFYVYDGGKHGLIAARTDQSIGIRWNGISYIRTSANANGVGAGLKNTTLIIAKEVTTNSNGDPLLAAATVCNEYSVTEIVGGISTTFGDWYLPSRYELNLLYSQKTVVGGFTLDSYWSSSENGNARAYFQIFSTGVQSFTFKDNLYRVRAVRAF